MPAPTNRTQSPPSKAFLSSGDVYWHEIPPAFELRFLPTGVRFRISSEPASCNQRERIEAHFSRLPAGTSSRYREISQPCGIQIRRSTTKRNVYDPRRRRLSPLGSSVVTSRYFRIAVPKNSLDNQQVNAVV